MGLDSVGVDGLVVGCGSMGGLIDTAQRNPNWPNV